MELSLYERMRNKLIKTADNFKEKIENVMYMGSFDDDFFDELEETLILSDLGAQTSVKITEALRAKIKETRSKSKEEVVGFLKEILVEMVQVETEKPQLPTIMLIVGVNGVGKTTTIAKLSERYKKEGKKLLLRLLIPFELRQVEQLDEWAKRVGVDIIKSTIGADPSSVIFDAIGAAKARKADILICDTAGRLHNKVNLMKELEKISRVINREGEGFSIHNLMVLDATTGQNAINQAQVFHECVEIKGIVLTKLDGTAKGGIAISIIDEMQIPIEYVGIGEKSEDLIDFDPKKFVDLLFE
ncbi:signal recognition particle-docking protein FtsY [Acetobacterium wieringae]|uniref:signal recognition particle-docking protein FtsY n=1 Tax=Acetobacterium wieringae TaxID=52694 RepID=UPI0020334B72|nr:signal recognition particle-docking protein FtsY [Acetobacterium wieringae]URN82977.1 signal recognition particle-docking protein FtsY [Acetobacterium wieringae]